jgi:hypothetical protein
VRKNVKKDSFSKRRKAADTSLHFICVHQTQQSAQVDGAVSPSGAFIALQNSILETNLQTFDCQGEKHRAQKRRRRVAHLPAMELEMPLAAKAHGSGRAKTICDKQSQQQRQYRQPQQHQWQQIRTQTQQNNSLPLRPLPPKDFFWILFFFLLKISHWCTYDIYLFY